MYRNLVLPVILQETNSVRVRNLSPIYYRHLTQYSYIQHQCQLPIYYREQTVQGYAICLLQWLLNKQLILKRTPHQSPQKVQCLLEKAQCASGWPSWKQDPGQVGIHVYVAVSDYIQVLHVTGNLLYQSSYPCEGHMQSDWCTDMLYTRVWAPVFLLKGSRSHFSRGLQGMQIFRSKNKHTKLQVDFVQPRSPWSPRILFLRSV